jgi:DNA-binding transcriptional ArsR family regulator
VDYEESELDAVFNALANPHRRAIIDLLSLQPASIRQLAERIGMSLTAMTRHISVLEESGLVVRKKSGRTNFLAFDRQTMRRFQAWAQQYETGWGTDDETLENYVAGIRAAEPKQRATKASNQ